MFFDERFNFTNKFYLVVEKVFDFTKFGCFTIHFVPLLTKYFVVLKEAI